VGDPPAGRRGTAGAATRSGGRRYPDHGHAAVTLLDPPDTGLGAVLQLDPAFAAWLSSISAGSDITMSSASPIALTVTGGTSTPPPTLSLRGTFAMPPASPANTPAVVSAGTAGTSIVAGRAGR
jgi:hypothetical protein